MKLKAGKVLKKLKLKNKFVLTIIIIVAIPMIILSMVLFRNMKDNIVEDKVRTSESNMKQNNVQIQKSIEMCNMTTQVFINNNNLVNYLVDLKMGTPMRTIDILSFYKNEIAALERMVNSNPYLYQTRVYVDHETMAEMTPILYQKKKMDKLAWANEDYSSGLWYYDYEDTIFPCYTAENTKHIMALITPIEDRELGELGVIEVAIEMEQLFPGIYNSTDLFWSCFIDSSGELYYDKEGKWSQCAEEIVSSVNNEVDSDCYETKIMGEDVVLSYKPIEGLNGQYIQLDSLKNEIDSVNQFRYGFFAGVIILLIILVFLVQHIVTAMLSQFYIIMKGVHEVQKGNLDVEIETVSNDEMGELSLQINKMLKRIKQLMADNINREVLVKNSEIRALQNQINAHFIYNVLESIKMMAEIEEQYIISDAVTALGKLLRYSMRWISKNVTVEEEVDYIKNYLALINLRFDYEIYLSINIPELLWKQEIPKMSLQPIIENALYHGIEEIAEDTSIYMKGIVYEDYFKIEITDSGKGMTEEEINNLYKKISGEIEATGGSGNGIGLKNVQDRIKISFGPEYGISVASKKGCFTKVIVKIPLTKMGKSDS